MTIYFDCFSGISGDMTVAALLDAGLDWDAFRHTLATLSLDGYELRKSQTARSAIRATKFDVVTNDPPAGHHHHQGHGRHLADIEALIASSGLPERVKARSLDVFRALGEAEAAVHGIPIEKIHFHEVGAVDSIIDIVGACLGLEMLGVTRVMASPLPVGRGMVKTAHGLMPVPAPATARLCQGLPTYPVDVEGELVTPTGAALLATLAAGFGPPPPMVARATGYGAGTKDFGERPNLLRVTLGEEAEMLGGWQQRELLLLETNIDDMSPQLFEPVMEKCFAAGALDVTLSPIQMKKNRPATTFSVLCEPAHRDAMLGILALHTTTLGVRVAPVHRFCLGREMRTVDTVYGPVEVKTATLPGGGTKAHAEYDSARRAADAAGVPVADVMRAAEAAAGME